MVEQQQQRNEPDRTWETRRQRAGIAAFITGLAATLAFFAFFPGLPHVIDWGANRGGPRGWRAGPVVLPVPDDKGDAEEVRTTCGG
jgi:hypothetical protein